MVGMRQATRREVHELEVEIQRCRLEACRLRSAAARLDELADHWIATAGLDRSSLARS